MHGRIEIGNEGVGLSFADDGRDFITIEGNALLAQVPIALRRWDEEGESSVRLNTSICPIDRLDTLEGDLLAAFFFAVLRFIEEQQNLRFQRFGGRYFVDASQQRWAQKPIFFWVHDYIRLVVQAGGVLDELLLDLHEHWRATRRWKRVNGLISVIKRIREPKERVHWLLRFLCDRRIKFLLQPEILTLLYRELNRYQMEEALSRLQIFGYLEPEIVLKVYGDEVEPLSQPTLEPELEVARVGINVWYRPRVSRRNGNQTFDL